MNDRDKIILDKVKEYPIYKAGYELFLSLYNVLMTTGMTENYKEYSSDGYSLYTELYLGKNVDKWIRR